MKQNKPKYKNKLPPEIRIINNICKECNRKGKIPDKFCIECWRDMHKTINLKGSLNE